MDADDIDFGQTIRGFTVDQIVFGRFRLKKLLGRGGMGVVWLGWDEKLDEQVALKFMPENVRMDEVAIHDLKRETRKSRQLTHPSIVRIHDFFESDETAAIAMEYVDGHTLSSLRLQQPHQIFQPSELEAWIRQLGTALTYAHGTEKVVHRDLKPSNLMVNSRGQLKVTDFGISSTITDSLSRVSMAHLSSGSPPYMSPQQLNGKAPSASDDIYSLGATLYELLTGKPPFYRGNIAHQVLEVQAPPVSAQRIELTGGQAGLEPIPPHLESGIARCLAKTPEDRPGTVEEAVAEILGESAPLGTKISKSPLLMPNNWKRNWPLLASLLAVFVVLAAGGIYKVASSGKPKYEVKPDVVVQTTLPVPTTESQPAQRQDIPIYTPVQNEQQTKAPWRVAAERNREQIQASVTPEQFEMIKKIWTRMSMESSKNGGKQLPMIGAKIISLPAYNRMDISADGINLNTKRCDLSGLSDNLQEALANADHGAWVYVVGQPMSMDVVKVKQAKILSPSDMDQAIQEATSFYANQNDANQNAGEADATAQNNLGNKYWNGIGVPKDLAKAVELYQKSANQGNADAQSNLGFAYANGMGVPKDFAKAVELYQKAADQGNALGQNNLGIAYANGTGVPKDIAKAVDLFRKSADQGYADAQNNLGIAYQNGIGVPKDPAKAAELFRKSAEQGYADAKNNLGLAYANGSGVPKDIAKAVDLFRKSADQGNAYAQNNLGWVYWEGTGVAKNTAKAAELFRKAADQGNIDAQNNMGNSYWNGIGVPKDLTKAVELYQKAAEQGNAYAQDSLGSSYWDGIGVAKDTAKALELYKKAADQGNIDALINLGFAYQNGIGVAKDTAKALELYKKAADQGNTGAQSGNGIAYEYGIREPSNAKEQQYQRATAVTSKTTDQ